MIVAIEGMDGAGKTTICNHIERNFGFINIEKPTKYFFKDKKGNIDQEIFKKVLNKVYLMNNRNRSEFFGKGNELAVTMYPNCDIVLDRHIASNYYWNGDKSLKQFYSKLVGKCGKPDITIFLYATPSVRYTRLQKRNKKEMDLYDKSIFEDGTKKHIEFLEEYEMPYVIIDTNNKTISQVCREVDSVIKHIKYNSSAKGMVTKSGRRF